VDLRRSVDGEERVALQHPFTLDLLDAGQPRDAILR
jgi:hypothetical protein